MAFSVFADRVKETTSTTGTGSVTLSGAVTGFRTFSSVLAVGDSTRYCIVAGTEWEVGVGILTGASTLSREAVLSSSNSDALVSFSAGAKDVFITVPAEEVVRRGHILASAAGVTLS